MAARWAVVNDPDGVLDVDHNSDTGTGLRVEFTDLADMLENVARQVLLDEQQHDIALGGQREAEESLRLLEPLAPRITDNRAARCAGLARRVLDALSESEEGRMTRSEVSEVLARHLDVELLTGVFAGGVSAQQCWGEQGQGEDSSLACAYFSHSGISRR